MVAKIDEYRHHTVLSWLNFVHDDPAANPANLGPETDGYQGLYGPWLSVEQENQFYPTRYRGPGYPVDEIKPNSGGGQSSSTSGIGLVI